MDSESRMRNKYTLYVEQSKQRHIKSVALLRSYKQLYAFVTGHVTKPRVLNQPLGKDSCEASSSISPTLVAPAAAITVFTFAFNLSTDHF